MPIILRGRTCCPVCGEVLKKEDSLVVFPAIVSNENDPLYEINDTAFHASCFASHALATRARNRIAEWEAKRSRGRTCRICGRSILVPDDYLAFVYFTDDTTSALHRWNYEQFHVSCLQGWDRLPWIIEQIESLRNSGNWKGPVLDRLIERLRALQG